jgi:hypothetical protein
MSAGGGSGLFDSPEGRPVGRAIEAFRKGLPFDEKCYFCGGKIGVMGEPAGGPYTLIIFGCPCGKSNGSLKGI